ncbi:Hypothetical protein CSU_0635, partial [Campylobacter jejuni subsp. jejuni 327]
PLLRIVDRSLRPDHCCAAPVRLHPSPRQHGRARRAQHRLLYCQHRVGCCAGGSTRPATLADVGPMIALLLDR